MDPNNSFESQEELDLSGISCGEEDNATINLKSKLPRTNKCDESDRKNFFLSKNANPLIRSRSNHEFNKAPSSNIKNFATKTKIKTELTNTVMKSDFEDCFILDNNNVIREIKKNLKQSQWINLSLNKGSINLHDLSEAIFNTGIPKQYRPKVWETYVKCNKIVVDNYLKYLHNPTKSNKFLGTIHKDALRTYSYLPFFQEDTGKLMLTNVLIAYSNYDEEVGYIQGMNIITAHLLFNLFPADHCLLDGLIEIDDQFFDQTNIEKTVFGYLVFLMENRGLRERYLAGLKGVIEDCEKLEKILQKKCQTLYNHITSLIPNLTGIFCSYFITLLLDQLEPTAGGVEGKILDIYMVCNEAYFWDFLEQAFEIQSTLIMSITDEEKMIKFLKADIFKSFLLK